MSGELSKFLHSLRWELKGLFRFPLFEVVSGLLTFLNVWHFREMGRSGVGMRLPTHLLEEVREVTMARSASLAFYDPRFIFLLSSVLAAAVFTRSLERGYLRDSLSLPVGRETLFLAKFTSSLTFLLSALVLSIVTTALFLDPKNAVWAILSPKIPVVILFVLTEVVLPLSISTLISIYSRETLLSVVLSFTFLFGAYNVSMFYGSLPFSLLNVGSEVDLLWDLGRLRTADLIAALAQALAKWGASLVTLGASLYYFARRLEVP